MAGRVRRGGDPSAAKAATRTTHGQGTVRDVHGGLLGWRNKPSTQRGYQSVIDRCIVPMLGRMKVQEVKRPDVATAMKKMAHKPAEANRAFSVMRKMFVWRGLGPPAGWHQPCRHVPMYPNGKATTSSAADMGKLFRQARPD